MSAQEFKRGAFNLCQISADSSESDSEEGLESTYPNHKKHVRTAKRAHMERQARTHSLWSGLRVAEETVIKLETILGGKEAGQTV